MERERDLMALKIVSQKNTTTCASVVSEKSAVLVATHSETIINPSIFVSRSLLVFSVFQCPDLFRKSSG